MYTTSPGWSVMPSAVAWSVCRAFTSEFNLQWPGRQSENPVLGFLAALSRGIPDVAKPGAGAYFRPGDRSQGVSMTLPPLTILNVNSDKEALFLSSRMLRGAEFKVLETSTVTKAVAWVRQHPDLIVIDTRLTSGALCEICRAILSGNSPGQIPVLHLVSRLGEIETGSECPLGIRHGRLHWPASASDLLMAIRDLLRPEPTSAMVDKEREFLGRLTRTAGYLVDPQGIVLQWSDSAKHLFGWSASEAVGHFLPTVDDTRRNEFLSMLSGAIRGHPLYRWKTVRQTRDGRSLSVAVSMLPILNDTGSVDRIRIVVADITENRRLHDELQSLSSIILASEDFICVINPAGEVDFLNPAGCRLTGVDGKAIPGLSLERLVPAAACAQIRQVAMPHALVESVFVDEMTFANSRGIEIPVSVQVVRLGAENSKSFALIARDIQLQKKSEANLLRLNRVHQMLGKCNQAIQQENDESTLIAAICRLITEFGGHRFAMVSLMTSDPDQLMQPAVWSGDDEVTVAELVTSWSPDHERGRGPTGAAVRSGQVVIRHDMGLDPHYAPWVALNERLGLRSAIALPLTHGPTVIGALSIYSTRESVFDAEETKLFEDLSRQLAHAIHTLRSVAAEQEATAMLRLFSGAIESLEEGVMLTDAQYPDHPILYVNPAFTRITGWEVDEVLGKSSHNFAAGDLQQAEMEDIRHAQRKHTVGQAVLRCFRKDGQAFWNEMRVSPIRNAAQEVTHYVSVIADVSERIRNENQMAHLAMHDPLTGLANRTLLNDRLRQAIVRAQRDGRLVAVLLIDLDRFKQINDTLGHGTGDILLQVIANRLKGLALESDTLARLGGDEFVLLLSDLENELDVSRTGQMLLDLLSVPFDIDGDEINVTPSIGASIYPRDASDAENLLRLADVAMYEVKESGRNAFRCFAPEMGRHLLHRMTMEKDLRNALKRGELILHYQPKADLHSGNITGVEALIRWQHPQRGLVSPAQFIPLAEQTGLIVPIGGWVLREACRQAAQWQEDGLSPLRVAVNLSPQQFRQPDLVEEVGLVLTKTGLDPCWLELEVTESLVMDNPEAAADFLKRLKKMGIRLAMDDFGTGYSSLGNLKRFPFDVLKIDQSFVQNIVSEPDDALIAVAVIAMAHSLGLQVIAEGVENESQMRYLRTHLCDEIQGYLLSRPLPAAELAKFLRDPRSLAVLSDRPDREERTLLLVDDEPDILNSLKRLLRRNGYRILTAGSAAEGLELLSLNRVQVIVSDQRMPIMSGSEFLSRVKSLYPDTMRIVLSGYTELDALTDAINRGAIYKFVTKPWDDVELRETIREAFTTHGHRAGITAAEHSNREAT